MQWSAEKKQQIPPHTCVCTLVFFSVSIILYAFIVFFSGQKERGRELACITEWQKEEKYPVGWSKLLNKYPPVMDSPKLKLSNEGKGKGITRHAFPSSLHPSLTLNSKILVSSSKHGFMFTWLLFCGCYDVIKRHLLLGRKVMTNLDSIFKSRDITLPIKVRLVKAMVFPVVMYGLWRKLSTEELMLLNCGVGEDSWESLGLQGDPINPF